MNLVLHGPLVVGSDRQALNVIYDTAVDGLALETDLCSSCNKASAFNTTTSSSYQRVGTGSYNIADDFPYYNKTSSYNATETVYLTYPSIRADGFPFYAITSQVGKDFDEVDGVLGFARQKSYDNNPLYMEKVKSTGHVSKEQISFYMGALNGTNYVDVGAYQNSSMKNGTDAGIAWFDQFKDGFFWEFKAVQGVQFGFGKYTATGLTAGYQYGYNLEAPAIVSTGNALIRAPYGLGYELQLRMSIGLEHYYDPESGVMLVNCNEKTWYQDFSLWIDDYEFEVLVDDYFLSLNDMLGKDASKEYEDVCMLGIVDDAKSSYWVLGDVFLRGYYTILDNDDHAAAKMGIKPHSGSEKYNVEKTRLPVESLENLLWELTWLAQIFPPSSPLSIISWLFGSVWVWLFGIYEWEGTFEVSVTIN